MQRPAQTRADAVVDGELPALLSRLTVAVHVVADFGTPGEARVGGVGALQRAAAVAGPAPPGARRPRRGRPPPAAGSTGEQMSV